MANRDGSLHEGVLMEIILVMPLMCVLKVVVEKLLTLFLRCYPGIYIMQCYRERKVAATKINVIK
jgi:hypothetical protein